MKAPARDRHAQPLAKARNDDRVGGNVVLKPSL